MQTIAIIECGAISEAIAEYFLDCESVEVAVEIIELGMDSRARDVFGDNVEMSTIVGADQI